MNTKKLIGTSMVALLVVALSVSMAAADGLVISPNTKDDPIILGDDSTLTDAFNVTWVGSLDTPVTAYWQVQKQYGSSWADCSGELEIRTGSDPYDDNGTQAFTTGDQIHIYDITDSGGLMSEPGDSYRVRFADGVNPAEWTYVCTVYIDLVPEFTTIAIPMVALLGLVLYMRRKKD